jgi:hypothetical protein
MAFGSVALKASVNSGGGGIAVHTGDKWVRWVRCPSPPPHDFERVAWSARPHVGIIKLRKWIMDVLAKQFIGHLNECEFAAKFIIGFAEMFAARLFAESRCCRISDGHEKLFFNTAKSLFNKNIDEVCAARGIYFNTPNERYINEAANEIAEYAMNNRHVKDVINGQLRAERKGLFDESLFISSLGEISYEEPLIETFVYWLDFIDQMKVKGLREYKDWFEIKRKLAVFLRITRATFQPGEIACRVTILRK